MKKFILIGTVGCGKTTISEALTGRELTYKKTQSVNVIDNHILDTPGEYLDMQQLRGALMITSADAEIIVFVQSATDYMSMFPPSYAGSFAKTVIGVVTKIDIATKEQIKEAENKLSIAGAQKIFKVSSYDGRGLEELKTYLEIE